MDILCPFIDRQQQQEGTDKHGKNNTLDVSLHFTPPDRI
jgi:hypothetical protein